MNLPILTLDQIQERLKSRSYPAQKNYLAMYSSWLGGITKEPGLMIVPVDDHLVHRGDGVFEAIKIFQGRVFLLDAHLQRLQASAASLSIPFPMSLSEIKNIILETARVSGEKNSILRLYISRGPGGFTTNPYDSIGSQMYLIVTKLSSIAAEKYEKGVNIGRSAVPPKDEWMAKIKSCNYLTNVMMKKESVDRNLDFTIGIDPKGFLTEGSTENIVILDENKILVRPKLRQILKGTTMTRILELAESLLVSGEIKGIEERDLTEADIYSCREAFMIGTTLDVLPIAQYEERIIGSGSAGPIGKMLLHLLQEDIKIGPMGISL